MKNNETDSELKKSSKTYDFIVSLGGNCSAAGQLCQRSLRKEAMPFDYFFLRNEDDIRKFIKAFESDFEKCFLKENLRELIGDQRGNSDLIHQYQDMVSGYNIIHLFKDSKENHREYVRCKKTIDKRLRRFYRYCELSNKICFMLTLEYEIDTSLIDDLYSVLAHRFPNKEIDLVVVMFSCKSTSYYVNGNIDIRMHERPINEYDYYRSNIDWIWIEDYKVKSKIKCNYLFKLFIDKRKVILHLFNYFTTLFRVKFYVLGFQLDICIGRLRDW